MAQADARANPDESGGPPDVKELHPAWGKPLREPVSGRLTDLPEQTSGPGAARSSGLRPGPFAKSAKRVNHGPFHGAATMATSPGERAAPTFRLLRYFTGLSLVIVLAAFLASGGVAVWLVHRAVIRMEQDEVGGLIKDLDSDFAAAGVDFARWGAVPVPDALKEQVLEEMKGFGITELSLLSTDGRVLGSLLSEPQADESPWAEGLSSASSGRVALRWLPPTVRRGLAFWSSKEVEPIESYIPVRRDHRTLAVARVRRNLSPSLQEYYRILPTLMGTTALIAIGVFAALWLLVRRADSTLRRQGDEIESAWRELAERNRQLEELNQRKDEFYAICSHDLRSPLLSVQAGCKVLLSERSGHASATPQEILAESLRSSELALRLVDDLLDLARIEAGAERLELEELDLGELSRQAVESFRFIASGRSVALRLEVPDESVSVLADRVKVLRIVDNLLSNAIKHSPEDEVTVRVERAGGEVHLSVTDRGPGIRPEDRRRLFDRFTRLARGKRTRAEGTGLGLSIVRELAELHGGTVSVSSEVGRGTTFRVTLPSRPGEIGASTVKSGPARGQR